MNEAEELEARIDSVDKEYHVARREALRLSKLRVPLIKEYYRIHTLEETVERFNSTEIYIKKIVGYVESDSSFSL